MIIKEVHVKNFRSILDESLPCDSLTALVGRNGSGKSSFLSVIELFYDPTARVTTADFYSEDLTQDIEIAVTFADLSSEARDLFSAYIDNDVLTVVRVFSLGEVKKNSTYHGMRLQNPDFISIRDAGNRTDARTRYNEIRNIDKYSELPTASSADNALAAIADWENQNPEQCERTRDSGQFFGFTQVGQDYLGRHTRFIRIPAVRDAQEDAIEKRGSCVTEIMNLVVRSALAKRKDLTEFKQRTQAEYNDIIDPERLTELKSLESELSITLQSYTPDASVLLNWSEVSDITIPLPQAQVKLSEDGYQSAVERTGHGLQRAFIVTMLQHLVAARSMAIPQEDETPAQGETPSDVDNQLPSLVLAIEEPELYQHPSRQRHLASVLLKLAAGTIPGVAKNTQVIYTTHSPLFVGLDRFPQIRVLRKVPHENNMAKVTRLKKADMGAVAEELWRAKGSHGSIYTAETLQPRLHVLMTPWMNEGFFADSVVLVEGEDDRAAILGVAKSKGHEFDSLGITVVPCFGKTNLDRPLLVFRQLDIPVYVVWDGDHGSSDPKPETNKCLLNLLDLPEEDWPDFVGQSSACFKVSLEKTLADEQGDDVFECSLAEAQREFDIPKKKEALKNAAVIQRIIEVAADSGKQSKSLRDIVENIVALTDGSSGLQAVMDEIGSEAEGRGLTP